MWRLVQIILSLLTLKAVADVRRHGVRIMADEQITQNDLDTLREAVDTETNRIADVFAQMKASLPAEGGLDAKQTASLKQWMQHHEDTLRAIGADPANPVPNTPPAPAPVPDAPPTADTSAPPAAPQPDASAGQPQ